MSYTVETRFLQNCMESNLRVHMYSLENLEESQYNDGFVNF